MSGKIVYTPSVKTLHERSGCAGLPNPNQHVPATRWQCDDCGQEWVVVSGSQYNETYRAWRKLNSRNRDGEDFS